ncbi:MAG: hypothetical protein K8I82_01195 [Anaerolineae bacterium]|nr:hypothetical protein [Anaerolineae bacterium]
MLILVVMGSMLQSEAVMDSYVALCIFSFALLVNIWAMMQSYYRHKRDLVYVRNFLIPPEGAGTTLLILNFVLGFCTSTLICGAFFQAVLVDDQALYLGVLCPATVVIILLLRSSIPKLRKNKRAEGAQ